MIYVGCSHDIPIMSHYMFPLHPYYVPCYFPFGPIWFHDLPWFTVIYPLQTTISHRINHENFTTSPGMVRRCAVVNSCPQKAAWSRAPWLWKIHGFSWEHQIFPGKGSTNGGFHGVFQCFPDLAESSYWYVYRRVLYLLFCSANWAPLMAHISIRYPGGISWWPTSPMPLGSKRIPHELSGWICTYNVGHII
jgi:hypothetical protein